jgi:hypothetical protein
MDAKILDMKINVLFLFFIILGCGNPSGTDSDIVPFRILDKVGSYHCWPYDVNVYSIDDIKIDSLFYTYPSKSYFGENPKYNATTWVRYDQIDTALWYGMDDIIKQCDGNNELHNQRLNGGDIYYAGIYQHLKNQQGEKRRSYEKILFLDLVNKRLHIFKDINKVY